MAAILQAARDFRVAATRCHGNGLVAHNGQTNPIIPGVVGLAMAVELTLKASLVHLGVTKRTHNLQTLYQSLPEQQQMHIRERMPCTAAEFDLRLAEVVEVFEEWRYVYEGDAPSFCVDFLEHLYDAAQLLAQACDAKERYQLSEQSNRAIC